MTEDSSSPPEPHHPYAGSMNPRMSREGSEGAMNDRRKQTGKEARGMTTGQVHVPYHVAAPETLIELMQRDLDAWDVAKAAIAKAQG